MEKALNWTKNNWKELLLVIFGVILMYIGIGAVLDDGEPIENVPKEPKTIYVGHDSKEPMENFSREGATEALVSIFKDIGESPDENMDLAERIQLLTRERKTMDELFTEKAMERIYYAEEFGEDEFNKTFTGSALLTYYELIVNERGEDFEAISETAEEIVHLDSKFMIAHIPLDVILGSPTGVAFEMNYIDGEWHLNPYTATMSLHLMGMMEANNAEQ